MLAAIRGAAFGPLPRLLFDTYTEKETADMSVLPFGFFADTKHFAGLLGKLGKTLLDKGARLPIHCFYEDSDGIPCIARWFEQGDDAPFEMLATVPIGQRYERVGYPIQVVLIDAAGSVSRAVITAEGPTFT